MFRHYLITDEIFFVGHGFAWFQWISKDAIIRWDDVLEFTDDKIISKNNICVVEFVFKRDQAIKKG